jgi:predicted AlkP superfamily phosphohydrolase/phosphomutase
VCVRVTKRTFFAASAVLAVLCAGWFGARRYLTRSPAGSGQVRLLIVGLDGADWEFIDPLLARGSLPNLDRLIRGGVRARLKTLQPALSPAIWTTVATGRSPEGHGVTGFEKPDKTGLVDSGTRRVEALWTMLTRVRRSSGFVGWWVTWPAEPVSGYMVSDHFLRPDHQGLTDATHPASLVAEIDKATPAEWPWLTQALASGQLKLFSDRIQQGRVANQAGRIKEGHFYYGQDHRGEQAAFHLLRTRPRPELFALLSRKIDTASHYMWEFLPPDRRSDEEYSRLLEPVYRYDDDLVARLLREAGPEANLLVISDHGFERWGEGYDHKESAPDGILIAHGPAFQKGRTLSEASVHDITPTVLHLLGLEVGRDMDGKVLAEALTTSRGVRWVDTWERGARAAGATQRSAVEEKIREELRALGYIH